MPDKTHKPLIDYANPQSEPTDDLARKRWVDRLEFWSMLIVGAACMLIIGIACLFVVLGLAFG